MYYFISSFFHSTFVLQLYHVLSIIDLLAILKSTQFYESLIFVFHTTWTFETISYLSVLKKIQVQTHISFAAHMNTFLRGENISKSRATDF